MKVDHLIYADQIKPGATAFCGATYAGKAGGEPICRACVGAYLADRDIPPLRSMTAEEAALLRPAPDSAQ